MSRLEATEERGVGMVTPIDAIADTNSVVVGEVSWARVGPMPDEGCITTFDQKNIRRTVCC